jgi:hypothetical protein
MEASAKEIKGLSELRFLLASGVMGLSIFASPKRCYKEGCGKLRFTEAGTSNGDKFKISRPGVCYENVL